MKAVSVFGVLLASSSLLGAQSREPVLPFPGPVEVVLTTFLPDPKRQSFSEFVTVHIRGIDGYKASEACFLSESQIGSGTSTVRILGRKKCSRPPPLLAGEFVPDMSVSVSVPALVHLVLP